MLIEKRSISGVIGKGDLYHNNRRFVAENVDKSRIQDNITIISKDVKAVYHELFDEALIEYNSKQKRKDRIIKDYHDHIRHSRQEKEFHEVIFQIGNKDDTPCGSDISQRATEALKQYKAIENIPTKKTLLGDNLTVSREDYENLAATAKKQIASEKKERKQKAEITQLQQENVQLKSELNAEKKKNADSKSINLRIENAKLKEQNSKMESVLKKAEEFLKGKGLYEIFQNFVLGIGINRNRNKDGLE